MQFGSIGKYHIGAAFTSASPTTYKNMNGVEIDGSMWDTANGDPDVNNQNATVALSTSATPKLCDGLYSDANHFICEVGKTKYRRNVI